VGLSRHQDTTRAGPVKPQRRPPVDVCIERVLARRAEKGTTRPFKPDRLRATWGRLALHHRAFESVARCNTSIGSQGW